MAEVKFQIEPILPADEAAVVAFLASQIERPGAEAGMPPGWLAWMTAAAACAGHPEVGVGWKLVAGGELAGVHLMVPVRVAAENGGESVTVQSSGFYVAPQWHGPASGALFLTLMKHRCRFHCSVSTANKAAGGVWLAFRGQPMPGSDGEDCAIVPRPSVIEEAVVRRVSPLGRLLRKCGGNARASLTGRLGKFRKRLGSAVTAHGMEAVEAAAALPWNGAGAVPSVALLRWRLSEPDPRHQLMLLEVEGRKCAAFCTASARGHRGQIPALIFAAVWGPAWEADPAAVTALLLGAARREFAMISTGFSPLPEPVRRLFRPRKLDAPRRWMVPSSAQLPPLAGWNGLDSL